MYLKVSVCIFLRYKSVIDDRMSGTADVLELLNRRRGGFEYARLAVEQFSQIVTRYCFIHLKHISHLFLLSNFDLYSSKSITYHNSEALSIGRAHSLVKT